MRAFIGVPLPAGVCEALTTLQRELAQAQADVTWVAPEQLHVTLKFLGEITETQRLTVEAMLVQVAAHHKPFKVSVKDLGVFPALAAARIVWVGLAQGAEALTQIAVEIEQGCQVAGFTPENRPFTAHVTLGRVRSSRHREALVSRLPRACWQPPEPWQVDRLTLYQSSLDSNGPHYTVLVQPSLGRKPLRKEDTWG